MVSDNWLRLIPTDPTFVPTALAAHRGRDLLAQFAPANESGEPAHIVDAGEIVFIDAGTNFERITCPWCESEIDLEWWQDCLTVAASSGFQDLNTRTRCCDVTTSLNDLRYDWPQGFARWWLEVMNPAAWLSEQQLQAVGEAVGHPVRAVLAHY